MFLHFECFISAESCIFYRILIYSDSKSGIQYLFLKKSLSFMLKKHFNMKTLTLIFIKKICYSSYIIVISLAKASSYFLTLFHYYSINSFINKFNLMISLSFSQDFNSVVLLLFFWNSGFIILISFKELFIKISYWWD